MLVTVGHQAKRVIKKLFMNSHLLLRAFNHFCRSHSWRRSNLSSPVSYLLSDKSKHQVQMMMMMMMIMAVMMINMLMN